MVKEVLTENLYSRHLYSANTTDVRVVPCPADILFTCGLSVFTIYMYIYLSFLLSHPYQLLLKRHFMVTPTLF